jgi:ureidoglycolate lyase
MKTIKAKPLTDENFKSFGWVMKKPNTPVEIETHWLRYWHETVDLSNLEGMGMMGFMQMKRVPIICEKLLILHNSIEMYISLDGKPSIAFVAPGDPKDSNKPDVEKLEAFILENGSSIIVNKGVWHWSPFPLTETADFALGLKNNVIFRKGDGFDVDSNEILYYDLEEAVGIEL